MRGIRFGFMGGQDYRAAYTRGGLTGLISERASGTSKYYHADALGSTRGLTDHTQAVTDTRERDAWGLTVSSTGSTATPFGFVGGQDYRTDPDSRLLLLPGGPAAREATPVAAHFSVARHLGASRRRRMEMWRHGGGPPWVARVAAARWNG